MRKGWEIIPLGNLCSIKSGDSDTKDAVGDGAYAFFDRSRTIKRSSRYLFDCEALIIPGEGTIFLPRHFIGKFDLHQRAYALFNFSARINVKFLYHYLHHIDDYFPRVAVGATVKSLRLRHFEELPVPFPGLSEQQGIVRILDKAFNGIATAKTNAEKNLQNARALFESHLQDVFTQRNDGCLEKPLREHVEGISTGPFGSMLHRADYERGGIPLINPIHIEGDKIVPDDRKAVGIATARRLVRYALRENDIVIGRRGEIGRCAVISREHVGWICGTGCFFIRPSDKTDSYFLTYLLRSRPYRGKLEAVAHRATMPSISNSDLANLRIRLPPMAQQRRAVALLERLAEETRRLESIYLKKLAALDAFKKSLLHQAFSGAL